MSVIDSSTVDRDNDYTVVLDMSQTAGSVDRNKKMMLSALSAPDDDFYSFNSVASVAGDDYCVIYSIADGGYRRISNTNFNGAPPANTQATYGWLYNGTNTNNTSYDNNLYRFTIAAETATAVTTTNLSRREARGISDHSTTIWIFGGHDGSYLTSCESITMATNACATVPAFALATATYRAMAAKATPTKGYYFGGYTSSSTCSTAQLCTYATTTVALTPTADLTVSVYGGNSIGDAATKCFSFYLTSTVQKTVFSTDTTSDIINTYEIHAFNKRGRDCLLIGNGDWGYIGHGHLDDLVKISYAIEVSYYTYNFFGSLEKQQWAQGMSDNVSLGWHIGGYSTSSVRSDQMSRLNFANDVLTILVDSFPVNYGLGHACNDQAN
jgi:hypothetical protein